MGRSYYNSKYSDYNNLMYSKVYSGLTLGIDGMMISVETDTSQGLPGLNLVGYLASSVKEAGERVRAALKNTGVSLPSRRITVNLSPADTRKDGALFDVAIAVGIILSLEYFDISDTLYEEIQRTLFLGELGLDGTVLPRRGTLPIVDCAAKNGIKRVILPAECAAEASYIKDVEICPVSHMTQVLSIFIEGKWPESYVKSDIPGIMPPLSYEESMELTKIYSVAGLLGHESGYIRTRPFRSLSQNISQVTLLGGGMNSRPGEVTLATGGVLFLDEFPEFPRNVIESLRQPMEDKTVTVSRLKASYTYPARFMLVSARNNCPCGFFPDRKKCHCNAREIKKYQEKISHPIMDRIDIRLEINPVSYNDLFSAEEGMSSSAARDKIMEARERQEVRFRHEEFSFNSEIPQGKIEEYIKLGSGLDELLQETYEASNMSARGYFRVLRLARTIADIGGRDDITLEDVEQALYYRNENEPTNWL